MVVANIWPSKGSRTVTHGAEQSDLPTGKFSVSRKVAVQAHKGERVKK